MDRTVLKADSFAARLDLEVACNRTLLETYASTGSPVSLLSAGDAWYSVSV